MGEPTRVLIGTTKGAFILNSDRTGAVRSLQGPLCDGWPINHMIGDRETGDLWAAGGGDWQGAGVWRSRDGGETWTLSKLANGQADEWLAASPELAEQLGMTPSPPAPFSGEVVNLWSLGRAGETLYAGAKPAALFASQDRGETWNRVQGLSDHPSSDGWEPGAAGLTLHTILSDPGDPAKLWIGISAAGVFASEDGGATWDRRNRLSNAVPPETHSHPAAPCGNQTGLCVHNLALSPGDRLYQQNHHGTYRSRDGGRTWDDITAGLPSTFGFPVAVHPEDPDTLWVLPLNGDSAGRFPPMPQPPSGGPAMAATHGRAVAMACRSRIVSLPSCGKEWSRTRRTPERSISAPTPAASLPQRTAATVGARSPATCPPSFASKRFPPPDS